MSNKIAIRHVLSDVPELAPSVSVMFRADHGIGKSSIVKQIWKHLCETTGVNYKFFDRRLSQMQAGDLLGLPSIDEDAGTTRWNPPDWYKAACLEPCIIHLDELNRADMDVTNGAFQIVLDHELNGMVLHPETRVYCSVNTDAKYNVHAIDPAMLDRFWVGDLVMTIEDWVVWAKGAGIHPDYIDWLAVNDKWLMPPIGDVDHTEVHPTPRSNEFAARAIHGLLEKGAATGVYDNDKIRRIAAGFIGQDAAIALCTHLKAEFKYTGLDILQGYEQIRRKIKTGRIDVMQHALGQVVDTLAGFEELGRLKGEEPNPALAAVHGRNIELLLSDMPVELRPMFYQKLAGLGQDSMALLVSTHKYMYPQIVTGFGVTPGKNGVGSLPKVHGMDGGQKKTA